MYADDEHLTYADKDVNIIQSCLNKHLLNISKWLIVNKLTLNMTKTEFNYLSRSKHQWYSRKPGINVKISRCTH